MYNGFIRFLLRIFCGVFYRYKIYGKENMSGGGAVIVCNHYSLFDPFYFADYFKKDYFILAKKELNKNKLVSSIVKNMGGISVGRDGNDVRAVLTGVKVLKEGNKLIIFPEGTRNKQKVDLLPLKSGTALFAMKAKVPIMPVAIYKKAKFLGRNYIYIGKPFTLEEFYDKKADKETLDKATEIIREKMLESKEELSKLRKKK